MGPLSSEDEMEFYFIRFYLAKSHVRSHLMAQPFFFNIALFLDIYLQICVSLFVY